MNNSYICTIIKQLLKQFNMVFRNYNWSVDKIINMFEKQLIVSKQKSAIWDKLEKTEFVHLLTSGVPNPPFYFEEDEIGKLHVLDILNGIRRFNAIVEHQSENDDFVFKAAYVCVNILIKPTKKEICLIKNLFG